MIKFKGLEIFLLDIEDKELYIGKFSKVENNYMLDFHRDINLVNLYQEEVYYIYQKLEELNNVNTFDIEL